MTWIKRTSKVFGWWKNEYSFDTLCRKVPEVKLVAGKEVSGFDAAP